ncbi:MAG: hypothetical protein IMX02_04480 [Limnochordaceae bacterium]|nr:hypothetical protein [Limnochordaceae bacterium]
MASTAGANPALPREIRGQTVAVVAAEGWLRPQALWLAYRMAAVLTGAGLRVALLGHPQAPRAGVVAGAPVTPSLRRRVHAEARRAQMVIAAVCAERPWTAWLPALGGCFDRLVVVTREPGPDPRDLWIPGPEPPEVRFVPVDLAGSGAPEQHDAVSRLAADLMIPRVRLRARA